MGVMDFLLGGSSQKRTPGSQGYVDNITNWANNIGTSLSPVGRQAKKQYAALSEGNYDSNPTLSGFFAPIRDMYATSEREGERNASMGVGAKFGQDNPILAQRVQQLNEERAREGEGQAMTRMIPALQQGISNTFEQDAAARDARMGMQGQGYMNALQGYLGSFYQKQQGGLLPALAGLAGAAGSIGSGFGFAAPHPPPSTPCWVAAELFGGWDDPRVDILRDFIFNRWTTRTGKLFARLYLRFGERLADHIRHDRSSRAVVRAVFERLLARALTPVEPS